MKIRSKGDMYIASKAIYGEEFPIFMYAKLNADSYLVTIASIFRKDPIKQRYAIVSKKKFLRSIKGHNLQKMTDPTTQESAQSARHDIFAHKMGDNSPKPSNASLAKDMGWESRFLKLTSVSVKVQGVWSTRALPYSPNKKMHHFLASKWKKAWQDEVWAALAVAHLRSRKIRAFNVFLYATHPQDYDNSAASIKGIQDGLVGSHGVVGRDGIARAVYHDSPKDMPAPEVHTIQVKEKRLERVEIELFLEPSTLGK